MFCSNCGQKLNGNFCSTCGKSNYAAVQQQPPTQYQQYNLSMNNNLPGTNFLLVTGILMIVFQFFGGVFSCISLVAHDHFGWMYGNVTRDMWQLTWFFELIRAIFGVVIGIFGVAYCRRQEKAPMLKVLIGIFMVIVFLIPFFDIYIGLSEPWVIFAVPFGLIVPILFYVGAHKNDNHYPPSNHNQSEE